MQNKVYDILSFVLRGGHIKSLFIFAYVDINPGKKRRAVIMNECGNWLDGGSIEGSLLTTF